ncbi:MAG: OmpH family outer membrane protein [Gemmataceae bacterium]|nr:OmpH family outer membrane protein [Gemmataceae bacterium]MDW8266225.1 OmpH family outer membrane protein [Gemmataceae bacterium]
MKRTCGIGLGATLGLAMCWGMEAAAQQPPAAAPPVVRPAATAPASNAPAPLRTRIALVNMLHVLKHYKKAQAFQEQLAQETRNLDKQYLEPIRAQITKLRADYQTTQDPARRDQIERESRKLQLELQEKEEDAKKTLTKKQGDWTVQLYMEIEDTVRTFAKTYDIELVLFYTDPTNPAEPYNPATIQRKLLMGAAMPLYAAPGMDISDAIVSMLNQRFPVQASNPAPGSGIQPVSAPAPR